MPLYEYQCDGKCGKRFEVIRKFSDPPLEKCPTCGGPVHKLQSSPAIQFKGSGWYITDYARKDQKSGGKSESDGTSESGGTTASESKESKGSTDKSDKPAEKKSSDAAAPSTPAASPATPSKD